jgi:REP element-mobilizing transposase RayT
VIAPLVAVVERTPILTIACKVSLTPCSSSAVDRCALALPHRERQRAGPSSLRPTVHCGMTRDPSRTSQGDPLAFFITFRCYGTWLPGDSRGWTDRPVGAWDVPLRSSHPGLHSLAEAARAHGPFVLESPHREAVDSAIRDVCAHRAWKLHALNVRTNHVHLVVSASSTPEQVMTSLKAWSTRRLREAGLVAEGFKPWSRHGSTRYLWRVDQIEAACSYVLEGQGGDLR